MGENVIFSADDSINKSLSKNNLTELSFSSLMNGCPCLQPLPPAVATSNNTSYFNNHHGEGENNMTNKYLKVRRVVTN